MQLLSAERGSRDQAEKFQAFRAHRAVVSRHVRRQSVAERDLFCVIYSILLAQPRLKLSLL